jgi:hypothetical protein
MLQLRKGRLLKKNRPTSETVENFVDNNTTEEEIPSSHTIAQETFLEFAQVFFSVLRIPSRTVQKSRRGGGPAASSITSACAARVL